MINLVGQKALKRARSLLFCYLCGQVLHADRNRDHLPPKQIFANSDRIDPLILLTHSNCNHAQSLDDERVAELLGRMHGRHPAAERLRLKYVEGRHSATGQPVAGVGGVDLNKFLFRCLRGFHAALYGEFLPDHPVTRFSLSLPFPIGSPNAQGEIEFEHMPEIHPALVRVIRTNRMVGRVDRIACYRGACIYECCWSAIDSGEPACIFALRIYDWESLGETGVERQRGCVGLYIAQAGRPSSAMTATEIDTRFLKLNELTAFD